MKPHQLTTEQAAALIARLLELHSQAALSAALIQAHANQAAPPDFTIFATGGTATWIN